MESNINENLSKKEKSGSDKKGTVILVVLSALVVILTVNAIKIQLRKSEDAFSAAQSDITQNTVVTLAPVTETTIPTTELTVPTMSGSENTQLTETTASAEMVNQEILNIITNGINTLKSSGASFTGHKVQVIDMELTECSVPSFAGIANGIIDMFTKTEIYDYDFTNGKGIDPESNAETTTMDVFPPIGKNFALTIDGVAQAAKEVQGENTVYTVKLVSEKSSKANPKTVYHENACDTLDLSSFSIPIGEITKADLEYPGATVGITLDKGGKVIGYYERLDIIGTGEAAAAGMSGGGTVEGFIDETWTIQWK